MEKTEKITLTREGLIARITLNRPEKLNALDVEMLDGLEGYIAQIDRDASCRAVIVDAAGDRAFCAGADITAWSGLPPLEMWRSWTRRGHAILERLESLLQPTVALIDGIAYGGGLELALSCDLIMATSRSRFAFPETTIAAIPGWGGAVRLAERIGVSRTKQMFFTGAPVDAQTAHHWGLVNTLCDTRDQMHASASAMVDTICANAPVAVSSVKQVLRMHEQSRWLGGAMESLAAGLTALTDDGTEGTASFLEKRPARFQGR